MSLERWKNKVPLKYCFPEMFLTFFEYSVCKDIDDGLICFANINTVNDGWDYENPRSYYLSSSMACGLH